MTIILSSINRASTLGSYAQLVASVSAWSHRTDLEALLPDFVTLAEARINRDIRVRQMITKTMLTYLAGAQDAALPDDWLEFKNLTLNGSPPRPLTYETVEQLGLRVSGGVPVAYSLEGSRLLLGPTPSSNTTVSGVYYAKFPSLLDEPTNWLMSRHPSIYLFAVMMEVMLYTQNAEQLATYTARYLNETEQLLNQDDRAEHSGSTLSVRAN
jgi:hypothetical protein